jgi:hypothetical protein
MAVLEERPDGVLMRASFGALYGFAHYLSGLEWPFIVLNPPELRDELRKLADRTAHMANRSL